MDLQKDPQKDPCNQDPHDQDPRKDPCNQDPLMDPCMNPHMDPCVDPCDQDPHNQTNHEVTSETTCPPSPSVFGTIFKATGM